MWEDLANEIEKRSNRQENRLVMAEICRYIGSSHFASEVTANADWLPNRVYFRKAGGSQPSKTLKMESITENRLEFCILDKRTKGERCFFPHCRAKDGLAKFKKIITHLDWTAEVKQYQDIFDYLAQMIGKPTRIG